MAYNVKSYTDISQSKILAEILPLESADMYYDKVTKIPYYSLSGSIPKDWSIPAWSLTALLNIIPKHIKEYNTLRIDIGEKDFSIWYDETGHGVNTELPDITMESTVDACYEMIVKLHKMNLL